MTPSESLKVFETLYIPAVQLNEYSMVALVSSVFSFYETCPARGIGEDGDMLLFESGSWDWGSGIHFQIKLTRQYIETGKDVDEDVISQFALTRLHKRSDEFAKLGSTERWCHRPTDLGAFSAWVQNHAVMLAAERATPIRTEIIWARV